jgi:hypothetical protein
MIYHSGQSAIKQSRGKLMDDSQMKMSLQISLQGMPPKEGVTIAGVMLALALAENPIPKFVKRSNKVARLAISAEGFDGGSTYRIEDIENTAVKTLEEKYTATYAKVAAGIAVKAVTSIAAGYVTQKALKQAGGKLGKFSGLIGAGVGAGVGAGLASQIKPDLRCWHSLPADLQMRRIFMAPGTYDLTISFIGADGAVLETHPQQVTIQSGKKTLLNYRTLF